MFIISKIWISTHSTECLNYARLSGNLLDAARRFNCAFLLWLHTKCLLIQAQLVLLNANRWCAIYLSSHSLLISSLTESTHLATRIPFFLRVLNTEQICWNENRCKYYLTCPRDYKTKNFHGWNRWQQLV